MKKKITLILLSSCILFTVAIIISYNSTKNKDLFQNKPRLPNKSLPQKKEPEVLTHIGIDHVLGKIKKVHYYQLNSEYRNSLGYEGRKDKWKVSGKCFYEIPYEIIDKNLIGNFKIRDFLVKDKYYISNKKLKSKRLNSSMQYLLIDVMVLHRFLDLLLFIKRCGYDYHKIRINYSFRYPNFNLNEGGVINSQHMWGKAIDIEVGDINKDGITDEEKDKKIVLDFLEKIFIKYGGIGRYPGSQTVHFDVRDKKARWNQQ